MKRALSVLSGILLICVNLNLSALDGEIVYVEGSVDLKTAYGDLDWADIGMPVETGDSIITGYDGYAELEMEDGSTVKVSEDSIFALSSYEEKGESQNSFNCVLGSVQYKFTKAVKTGEPRITTPATVCGVRGTEFTVVSGLDGSAMYVVDSGMVAVTAKGKEVILGELEGVRVDAGEAPGEIFPVLRGQVDFSQVRAEAEQRFLDSPAASMKIMTSQLQAYIAEMEKSIQQREDQIVLIDELRKKFRTMEGDAKQKFYDETVFPEEMKVTYMALNIRYYSLSSFSLRRFLVGNMYINLRTKYILDPSDAEYQDFLKEYKYFLTFFENRVIEYLVPADL
ncbi:MAG: hypothetical protein B6241_14165 [Spirochaetaceae bacterium 4572_59]|nr:MAG: hypothetical protein B6241_14165 [Spirochaetaceae bacterium 4572_59]